MQTTGIYCESSVKTSFTSTSSNNEMGTVNTSLHLHSVRPCIQIYPKGRECKHDEYIIGMELHSRIDDSKEVEDGVWLKIEKKVLRQ